MKIVKLFSTLALLVLLCAAVPAQEKPPEKLGKVSFPTSCDRKVQAQFDRAVAMLHSFWFQQGEQAFREILQRDPSCAIANWGIAAILIGHEQVGKPRGCRKCVDQFRDIVGRAHSDYALIARD